VTVDRQGFQNWLDRYVEAWKTYDEQKIGDLFSEDVVYRYSPQDEGLKGRAEVVKSWLDDKDEPGTYDARYQPVAIDGDVHVANGWSRYYTAPGGDLRDEYFNVYICKFDDEGRCRAFTEYWIQNRDFRRRDREQLMREAHGEASPTAATAA
jgi:ketosteroid isomerase-like protein